MEHFPFPASSMGERQGKLSEGTIENGSVK
jgi:hypothetical protein